MTCIPWGKARAPARVCPRHHNQRHAPRGRANMRAFHQIKHRIRRTCASHHHGHTQEPIHWKVQTCVHVLRISKDSDARAHTPSAYLSTPSPGPASMFAFITENTRRRCRSLKRCLLFFRNNTHHPRACVGRALCHWDDSFRGGSQPCGRPSLRQLGRLHHAWQTALWLRSLGHIVINH
jgi:hypothetical protein